MTSLPLRCRLTSCCIAQYLPSETQSSFLNYSSHCGHAQDTILALKSTSCLTFLRYSSMFDKKSRDLSSLEVYHTSTQTLLSSFVVIVNSAFKAVLFQTYSSESFKNCFSLSPYFLSISIAGILIPAPVPSSETVCSLTFSCLSSIIKAKAPPNLSMFLTY